MYKVRKYLIKQVIDGNSQNVSLALFLGSDPNTKSLQDHTLLHYAARWNQVEIIKILVAYGANLESRNYRDDTPLHRAARWGMSDAVRVLAELGGNVNVKGKYAYTPLHDAAFWGHTDTVSVLIELGADINARAWEGGHLPLESALWAHNPENRLPIVKSIVSAGAMGKTVKVWELYRFDLVCTIDLLRIFYPALNEIAHDDIFNLIKNGKSVAMYFAELYYHEAKQFENDSATTPIESMKFGLLKKSLDNYSKVLKFIQQYKDVDEKIKSINRIISMYSLSSTRVDIVNKGQDLYKLPMVLSLTSTASSSKENIFLKKLIFDLPQYGLQIANHWLDNIIDRMLAYSSDVVASCPSIFSPNKFQPRKSCSATFFYAEPSYAGNGSLLLPSNNSINLHLGP